MLVLVEQSTLAAIIIATSEIRNMCFVLNASKIVRILSIHDDAEYNAVQRLGVKDDFFFIE